MDTIKKKILTGDRPTGCLHLGHLVGSIQNRVRLQDEYDCHFIIADLHTLTTKPTKEQILQLREHVYNLVLDYLSCGIDAQKSIIYLQSAVPAIYELKLILEMMIGINRLAGLPSLKEMAKNAHLDSSSMSVGLFNYPVLQTADILLCQAHLVPVGKDNLAHIEIARDIVRRFNQLYGDTFPEPQALLSATPTLIGTDGKSKMSKSAGNAIFLSDEPAIVEKKVRSMFTDPNRANAHTPGNIVDNPVFIYHDLFNTKAQEVADLKARYKAGTVGDVEVKDKLARAINEFLAPLRVRRKGYQLQTGLVEEVIYEGTQKMITLSQENLKKVRAALGLHGLWNKIARVARARQGSPLPKNASS